MSFPKVLPKDDGIRPAGRPDQCFYCRSMVGEEHKKDCVTIDKIVEIEFTVRVPVKVPHGWDQEMINFRYNDSSWCADNLPLLFEENLEGFFDDIWLVDTSIDKQIERISIRDGISKDDALKIIEKQLSREEKLKRCSKVINNENEDMKNLELQIDALLEKVGFNGK